MLFRMVAKLAYRSLASVVTATPPALNPEVKISEPAISSRPPLSTYAPVAY
jgi:hypothetical protein